MTGPLVQRCCVCDIPLLSEEGWLRDQIKLRSHLWRADGVVNKFQNMFVMNHHPVRSIKGGFAPFLLLSRPPLLEEEGNIARFPRTTGKPPDVTRARVVKHGCTQMPLLRFLHKPEAGPARIPRRPRKPIRT